MALRDETRVMTCSTGEVELNDWKEQRKKEKRRALSAALAGNGCGCFVPDLTRLTMPQCAGARRGALYPNSPRPDQRNHCSASESETPRKIRKQFTRYRTSAMRAVTCARCQIPRSFQMLSTRFFTSSLMTMGVPHSRLVSPGHLLVASMPILLPSPLMGEAKSR